MPTNKNAQLRYNVLDNCFRNYGRKYYIDDLVKAVNHSLQDLEGEDKEVKKRQIYDDIRFMESEEGWSIPLERKRDGKQVYFRYTDPTFSINNIPLTDSQIKNVNSAIEILSSFSGMNQFEVIREMIPVLKESFGLSPLNKQVISLGTNLDYEGLEHIDTIYEAILNQQVLQIEYDDFKDNEPYTINFHPHYLREYNNRWIVHGLFPGNDRGIDVWNVALDRIVSISLSKDEYISSNRSWEDYFYETIGITRPKGKEVTKVKLAFSKEQKPYVKTKPIHGTQRVISDEDEYVIEIKVIPNFELESKILSFGERVRVIEPKDLKERIKERLSSAINNY